MGAVDVGEAVFVAVLHAAERQQARHSS